MLDSDLAELYGYEVKNLNRQVKRNIRRFPKDFMFQLTRDEMEILRCQNVTANVKSRTLPYAFTEQGIYMLATVLRGELAEQQSIFIMRAFREMRHFIANNAALFDRISKVELKQLEYQKHTDERFDQIFEYIGSHKETNQKLFFDGQIYDAFSLLIELIQKAKQSGVSVSIYTFQKTKLTAQDIVVFNAQYPQLDVKYSNAFHDRFLILDGKTVYHIGASLKDAGKKSFAVMLMKNAAEALLEKLESI